MQTAANRNLVFITSSSFGDFSLNRLIETHGESSCPGFYQQIWFEVIRRAHRDALITQYAERLAALAYHEFTLGRVQAVERIAHLLRMAPVPTHYHWVAAYYDALCMKGHGRIDEARSQLEVVANEAPLRYRAKAMISMGSILWRQSKPQMALPLFREAHRIASSAYTGNLDTAFHSQKMVAVILSDDGNHRGALDLLQSLAPVVRFAAPTQPFIYYDYMNSLAVELTALGNLDDAQRRSQVALRSPYALSSYDWQETYLDILRRRRGASRSVVALNQLIETENLVQLPVPGRGGGARPVDVRLSSREPAASVLNFQNWKTQMTNPQPSKAEAQLPDQSATSERELHEQKLISELERMTVKQKRLKIMDLMSGEKVNHDKLNRILLILQEPVQETAPEPNPVLEQTGTDELQQPVPEVTAPEASVCQEAAAQDPGSVQEAASPEPELNDVC